MRIRKKKWAEPELSECRYYINDPEQYRGRWKEFFGNDKPIELEIGCGKCTFIAEKALKNPDTNYIAVPIPYKTEDKHSSSLHSDAIIMLSSCQHPDSA